MREKIYLNVQFTWNILINVHRSKAWPKCHVSWWFSTYSTVSQAKFSKNKCIFLFNLAHVLRISPVLLIKIRFFGHWFRSNGQFVGFSFSIIWFLGQQIMIKRWKTAHKKVNAHNFYIVHAIIVIVSKWLDFPVNKAIYVIFSPMKMMH